MKLSNKEKVGYSVLILIFLEAWIVIDTAIRAPNLPEKEVFYPNQSDATIITSGIITGNAYFVCPFLGFAFLWYLLTYNPKEEPEQESRKHKSE